MVNIEIGQFFDEMARFSALSLCVRTLRSIAPASKNEGSAHRAARRVARTMSTRKAIKTYCKIAPKSIEVARSGYIEAPKSIGVGRSGSVEAPKAIEVGRSRPGTTKQRSSWHARSPQNQIVGKPRWSIIVLMLRMDDGC